MLMTAAAAAFASLTSLTSLASVASPAAVVEHTRAQLAAQPSLEPITVVAAHVRALRVNASSGGCTRAADFRVLIEDDGALQRVSVLRLRPDTCEAYAPMGTTVTVSVPSLDLERPIVVENPLFVPGR